MRRASFAFIAANLALAGCGGGPVELDIVEIGAPVSSRPAAPAGPDSMILDVGVRAGQLRSVLEHGGQVDLAIFECASPSDPGATVPVYFGGEPLEGMMASQISDDPEMMVGLSVAVPRSALNRPRACARFVSRSGAFAPEIISRPVPVRAVATG